MESWLSVPEGSDFPLDNLPFGIISTAADPTPRPAVAIGDHVFDLKAFKENGGFDSQGALSEHVDVFAASTLNAFAACGRAYHRATREWLQNILAASTTRPALLRDNEQLRKAVLLPQADVRNHLPLEIGDYTDFYAGKNHAYNIGVLFRGPDNALQPNYTHLPVAYHGRASSVVVSGTPIRRPWGQILRDPKAEPKVPFLAPCERLDLELELGMFVCGSNPMGTPIAVDQAEQYIFGYVLMNDWSARDIQAWEYVPLGPFTAKNMGTTISPWVVLADAVPKAAGIPNNNELLPYLKESLKENVLKINLEVDLTSKLRPSPHSITIFA
jgi:fumarylacetoacetase